MNSDEMSFDWSTGGLAEGLRCYRAQEFFEAHEHWEGVWLQCQGPDKTFLQALIQITAAFHHLRKGTPAGTASLLRRALGRLEGYPDEYGGIAVEPLRESVRAWLNSLEQKAEVSHLTVPTIR